MNINTGTGKNYAVMTPNKSLGEDIDKAQMYHTINRLS
jgi:hypothetical protein